eukprot:239591-Rhodomonas_salina.1
MLPARHAAMLCPNGWCGCGHFEEDEEEVEEEEKEKVLREKEQDEREEGTGKGGGEGRGLEAEAEAEAEEAKEAEAEREEAEAEREERERSQWDAQTTRRYARGRKGMREDAWKEWLACIFEEEQEEHREGKEEMEQVAQSDSDERRSEGEERRRGRGENWSEREGRTVEALVSAASIVSRRSSQAASGLSCIAVSSPATPWHPTHWLYDVHFGLYARSGADMSPRASRYHETAR